MVAVKAALIEIKDILQVEYNKRVGSILIIFDKTKLNTEQIVGKIKDILNLSLEKINQSVQSANTILSGKTARTLVKRTLLIAGILTVSAIYYSYEKHMLFAKFWIATMLLHIYQNRRTILK